MERRREVKRWMDERVSVYYFLFNISLISVHFYPLVCFENGFH